MDGTIRDLAGLCGTYRLIDKTDLAIQLIGEWLEEQKVKKAKFYLDAPVSNSGRLGQRILERLASFTFEVEIATINQVDSALEVLENVVTSDAIILNKCTSWINMNRQIIDSRINSCPSVDFSKITKP